MVLRKKKIGIFPVLIILSLFSLFGFIVFNFNAPNFAYFSPVTRFWELAAGGIAFGISQNLMNWKHAGKVANASAIGLFLSLFLPIDQSYWSTIIIVCLTGVLLITLRQPSITQKIFSMRLPVMLGKISYSLYLWHWFVLWLSRLTIGIEWWTLPFQLGLMLALAIASYELIENPLRHRPWSTSYRYGFLYGAGALSIITISIATLENPLRGKLYLGHITGQKVPENLQRTWWVDKATGTNLEPCHIHAYDRSALERCLASSPKDQRTIFLIGDSHARNYLPAVRDVFKNDAIRYLTIGHGCAFVDEKTATTLKKFNCPEYVQDVESVVMASVKADDIVVIGQRLFEMDTTRTGPLYFAKLGTFAAKLAERQVSLILLDAVLPPAYPPERCLDVPWRRTEFEGCSIRAEKVRTEFKAFDAAAQALTHDHNNVFYAPLRMGLCVNDLCSQILPDGTPIWHDRGHITERAAVKLSPLLRAVLEQQHFPFK